MGRLFLQYVDSDMAYCCRSCSTCLSQESEIISRNFNGRGGKAYLLDKVVNVYAGPHEKRVLMTGLHTVADLFCTKCHTLLGWTYIYAYEESEKYKVGKFILEKSKFRELAQQVSSVSPHKI